MGPSFISFPRESEALMPDASPPPKDVADVLEQMAKHIRADPSFLAAQAKAADGSGVTLYAAPEVTGDEPTFGEVDLQRDAGTITVTAQTRNADANAVHVTLSDHVLTIGLGDGVKATRRDLTLPVSVDEERAVATFRNGVLDIVLPIRAKRV